MIYMIEKIKNSSDCEILMIHVPYSIRFSFSFAFSHFKLSTVVIAHQRLIIRQKEVQERSIGNAVI